MQCSVMFQKCYSNEGGSVDSGGATMKVNDVFPDVVTEDNCLVIPSDASLLRYVAYENRYPLVTRSVAK